MYYISSEYYNGDIQCLICLSESKKNDVIKKMKEFSNLYIICDCNPTFHYTCLENWVERTSSCPICRKKIIINEPDNIISLVVNPIVNPITHFIFYCDFNIFILRIISIVLMINLFLFFIYNFYFMNYMIHEYSYDHFNDEIADNHFNESFNEISN